MVISLITPLYQGKKYLHVIKEMIIDNLNNLAENICIEWIISNDDPNEKININENNGRLGIKCINAKENGGIQEARKRGYIESTGDYILFLDQDDKISENFFQSQLSSIGNADAVICRALEDKEEFYEDDDDFEYRVSKSFMLEKGNGIISPGQVLIKRGKISDLWFNNNCRTGSDDYLLWLGMIRDDRVFALNNDILYEHVLTGENHSIKMGHMVASTVDILDVAIDLGGFKENELKKLKKNRADYLNAHMHAYTREHCIVFFVERILFSKKINRNVRGICNNYEKEEIAVYGAGTVGRFLRDEMKLMGCDVSCFIDKNATNIKMDIPVIQPSDIPSEIRMIIISTLFEQEEIRNRLSIINHNFRIVLLNELL